jgi:hypothetical protein
MPSTSLYGSSWSLLNLFGRVLAPLIAGSIPKDLLGRMSSYYKSSVFYSSACASALAMAAATAWGLVIWTDSRCLFSSRLASSYILLRFSALLCLMFCLNSAINGLAISLSALVFVIALI